MATPNTPADSSATPRRWDFPVLRFLRRALANWRERHRDPFNFAIHLVGIPLAVAGALALVALLVLAAFGVTAPLAGSWYWCLAAVFVGYLLQYIGHRVEGNDVGEWAAVKRLLGLPYVAVSPRWQAEAKQEQPSGQPR